MRSSKCAGTHQEGCAHGTSRRTDYFGRGLPRQCPCNVRKSNRHRSNYGEREDLVPHPVSPLGCGHLVNVRESVVFALEKKLLLLSRIVARMKTPR